MATILTNDEKTKQGDSLPPVIQLGYIGQEVVSDVLTTEQSYIKKIQIELTPEEWKKFEKYSKDYVYDPEQLLRQMVKELIKNC